MNEENTEGSPALPVPARLSEMGWFRAPGAYVLVDGQFGSTGKGLCEQLLATLMGSAVNVVTTNAGPNSGHTIYDIESGVKFVTRQIPSFSVALARRAMQPQLVLNNGAIIDPEVLADEQARFPGIPITVLPFATAILPEHRNVDATSLLRIASTNKGTGPALAAKIMRERFAVADHRFDLRQWSGHSLPYDWSRDVVFVSTAQGYSLGLDSGFYPYTTCRNCTVQQALADAKIPARQLRKVIATYRTFPIRVGNTPLGVSGGCYPDQSEISWSELGVAPETTTVTGRERRIFTWSETQFAAGLRENEPDAIFLNFLNYFRNPAEAKDFVKRVWKSYRAVLHRDPDFFMLGFGPRHSDVSVSFSLTEAVADTAHYYETVNS